MKLADLNFQNFSLQESIQSVAERAQTFPQKIFFVNAHCVNISRKDLLYKQALLQADFLFNDGVGLSLAAKLKGEGFKDNLNGTDWIPEFLESIHHPSLRSHFSRIYLLGTQSAILEKACLRFQEKWPNLKIVGRHHGFFEDQAAVLASIALARPDVILVGMGVPKQELFIHEHWSFLKTKGVKIAIAGGAFLDFFSREIPRAPLWMRRYNLEWIFRLIIEPKRLWKRYLIGNFQFLKDLILEYLSEKK